MSAVLRPTFYVVQFVLWGAGSVIRGRGSQKRGANLTHAYWPAFPLYVPSEASLYLSPAEPTLKLSYSAYLLFPSKSAKSTRSRWRASDVSKWRLPFPARSSYFTPTIDDILSAETELQIKAGHTTGNQKVSQLHTLTNKMVKLDH